MDNSLVLCTGKLPKKEDRLDRTLLFAKYVGTLAPPQLTYDGLMRIYNNLGITDPGKLFPMDGNDQLGDCVMAGGAHILTNWYGMINKKKIPTRCATVRQYKHLTGGQDTGLNMLDTLNYWRQHGLFGEKIDAFVENNIKNQMQLMQSISVFGGLYFGANLQVGAQDDFRAGRIWTKGPLSGDGHCMVILSYDQNGVTLLTWGAIQKADWDWVFCCLDEGYTILPKEAEKVGFAPGYDFATLEQDLTAVTAIAA
jgi:hypothetical protein